jgi:hypothetical protein
MQYVNLLGTHAHCEDIRSFANRFFESIGARDREERESSNYVDGCYMKGWLDGMCFTVSLNDDVAHEDLPYWVQVTTDTVEPNTFTTDVETLIRNIVLQEGFRFAHIVNFGKRGEQRIDY